MCSSLIVPLLVLRLAASLSAADADGMPSMALVPHKQREEETEAGRHHRLAKRQSTCIYFFLFEPPGSLQCNPQVDNTLTLGCNFLVGRVSTSMSLRIGWFFSRDGVVGERQQVSQFQVLRPFVAFESVLVVSGLSVHALLTPASSHTGAERSSWGLLLLSGHKWPKSNIRQQSIAGECYDSPGCVSPPGTAHPAATPPLPLCPAVTRQPE